VDGNLPKSRLARNLRKPFWNLRSGGRAKYFPNKIPISASDLSDTRFHESPKLGRGARCLFGRNVWRKPLAVAADAAMPDLWI
jgi:hypothetical protein